MKYRMNQVMCCFLIIVILCNITGCSFTGTEKAMEANVSVVEEPKEIVIWYNNEELSEYVEKAAAEFQVANQVSVITKLVSGIDYIETMNQAVVAEDQAPDLFIAESSDLEKIYLAGLAVENSDSLLTKDTYYENALQAFTYKDKLLAYPFYFETSYLLYNGDYVSQPPSTMEDILAFADTFDAPEGVESIFNWDVTDILTNYFFIGNYLNNENMNQEGYVIDQEKLTEAFNYYQSLNQYFPIDAKSVDYEASFQNFIDGKSVFTIAKTDKLPEIEMIEGDGNDAIQNDSNATNYEDNKTNEEGLDEAEKTNDSKTQDEKDVSKSDETTSKDDETNHESTTKESMETSQNFNSLDESYYAGIEKALRKITMPITDVATTQTNASDSEEPIDTSVNKSTDQEVIGPNIKIAPIPDLTDSLKSRGIAFNYGIFISGYSEKQKLAKEFAKYLSYDKAKDLYKEAGKLSVNKDIVWKNENINAVLKQYENTTYAPKIMEDGDYWLKLEISFSNIWKGESVDQVIEELKK